MPRFPRLASLVLALAAAGCSAGGRHGAAPPADLDAATSDAPAAPDAPPLDATPDAPPMCSGTADGGRSGGPPAGHIATDSPCGPSYLVYPDAGTCQSDADCKGVGLSEGAATHCLHGVCTYDDCDSDGDCAPGSLCACQDVFISGSYNGANGCVPAGCVTDGDCPAGQYCVQSPGTYCGMGSTGRACTTPADTCVDPQTDCPCPPAGGWGGGYSGPSPICVYSPAVARWICGATSCNG